MYKQNILIVDTSSPHCFVAGRSGKNKIASRDSQSIQSHNEELLVLIDEVLSELELSISEIDCLIIGSGPGSFTGLRIGYSTLKGITAAVGCKIASVSSFILLSAASLKLSKKLLIVSDARREEYFYSIYELADTELLQCAAPAIANRKELIEKASKLGVTSFCGLFEGAPFDLGIGYHRAHFVAEKCFELLDKNMLNLQFVEGVAVASLLPSYIRQVAAKTIAERS